MFAQSVAEGIISSLILFFIPYGAFHDALRPNGSDLTNHKAFGVMVASALIITVTLRVSISHHRHIKGEHQAPVTLTKPVHLRLNGHHNDHAENKCVGLLLIIMSHLGINVCVFY